jgi:hypothetical protein
MQKLFFAAMLVLAACSQTPPQASPEKPIAGPFIGLDAASLPSDQRRILEEATDDFLAVAAGASPIHAKMDEEAALPADGGTIYYTGNGYELTALKAISSFGDFEGHAYGPILTFNEDFAPGNYPTVSDVRVYSDAELAKLFAEANGR